MPKQVTPQAVGTLLRRQNLPASPARKMRPKLSSRRADPFFYEPLGAIFDRVRLYQPKFGDLSERVVDLRRKHITWHENPSKEASIGIL